MNKRAKRSKLAKSLDPTNSLWLEILLDDAPLRALSPDEVDEVCYGFPDDVINAYIEEREKRECK